MRDRNSDGRNELLDEARRQPELGNWHAVIPYAGVLAAATFLVLLIVSVTLYMEDQRRAANMPPSPEATEDWQARIITVPNSDSYKAALSAYTSSEHRAGTDAGHDLAVWTQAQLEKEGFSVHVYQYTVLLSYPTFLSAKLLFPIQYDHFGCIPR